MVIPQSLASMEDVTRISSSNANAIYYKTLTDHLEDIEFYSNQLCLVYIEEGQEQLVNCQNQMITLNRGDAILLCQGQSLHSDFVRKTTDLRAWLVFFSPELIEQYTYKFSETLSHSKPLYSLDKALFTHQLLKSYFSQLKQFMNYGVPLDVMLNEKLIELLNLLQYINEPQLTQLLYASSNQLSLKRNLLRLLSSHDILPYSIEEIATLSGRSLSGFHRDFKRQFTQTPKQWLVEKRMQRAETLLKSSHLSITDIAYSIGYSNTSHFIKTFKSTFGVTPKQHKLNCQS